MITLVSASRVYNITIARPRDNVGSALHPLLICNFMSSLSGEEQKLHAADGGKIMAVGEPAVARRVTFCLEGPPGPPPKGTPMGQGEIGYSDDDLYPCVMSNLSYLYARSS